MYCSPDCRRSARKQAQAKRSSAWRKRVIESGETCGVSGCDKPPIGAKGMCSMHYRRQKDRGNVGDARPERVKGVYNWRRTEHGYIARGNSDGGVELQHRVVMEEHLGRSLWPYENVHHINGVRDDNRLENLEIWITPQPAGQRPEDLVRWVVDHYADDVRKALKRRDE